MGDLPPGFVEVAPGVFEGPRARVGPGVYQGRVRVELGIPDDDHDCDAMGCGPADHVIRREVLSARTPTVLLDER